MTNIDVFALLNIPDDGSVLVDDFIYDEASNTKYVFLSRTPSVNFCSSCGCIMHSRGIRKRSVLHPVLQDGSRVILKISQRRYRCTGCGLELNESFPFVQRYKRYSAITPVLILDAMKDLNRSAVSVAAQFGVSDTEVHDIFSQYVDLKRLCLPEFISIDEVYLNIDYDGLYAFVIMDFVSGEIVDIVHNRWSSTLADYFIRIPLDERRNVKGVISDAYGPYQSLCDLFFPDAVMILDSFHVVKYLLNKINIYINDVLKRYRKKQAERLNEKNYLTNSSSRTIKDSEEIILLRDYRWIILKNNDSLSYSYVRHYHRKLGYYTDTYEIERKFFSLDRNFEKIRDLKELYIRFNSGKYSCDSEIDAELDRIIEAYNLSGIELFREFAGMIRDSRKNIIRSFTTAECSRKSKKDQDEYYARLSNGPMESFNRKPKDLKRNSRGFSNFDYTRNRILWSTRKNPSILGVPKTLKQIHSYHRNNRKSK